MLFPFFSLMNWCDMVRLGTVSLELSRNYGAVEKNCFGIIFVIMIISLDYANIFNL